MGRANLQIIPKEASKAVRKPQRAHQPEVLGSRVFQKKGSPYYYVDLRWAGGGRTLIRNPDAIGWPEEGEPTDKSSKAKKWAAKYDEHLQARREEAEQRRTGKFRSMRLAVPAFIRHREAQYKPSTVSGSSTACGHLVEYVGENADPARIEPHALQTLADDFLHQEYKASSVRALVNHWIVFFEYLAIEPNPARAVVVPKHDRRKIKPWSEEERLRIGNSADELDAEHPEGTVSYRRLAEYLLNTGARLQEAAAARWEHINEKAFTVEIANQISRLTNEPTETKGREERTTVMLHEWWPHHKARSKGLLFPGEDGKPVPYRKLYDYVRAILERAGMKKTGEAAHQFRHTYSFLFLQRKGTLDQLSKCLGHKRVSTTQMYYDHFTSKHSAEAAVEQLYGERKTMRRGPRGRIR